MGLHFLLLTLTVDVTNFHKSLVEARLPNSHDSFVGASLPWRSLVPRTAPQGVKTEKRLPSKKLTKTHGGLGGFWMFLGWNFWSLNWIQQTWVSKGGGTEEHGIESSCPLKQLKEDPAISSQKRRSLAFRAATSYGANIHPSIIVAKVQLHLRDWSYDIYQFLWWKHQIDANPPNLKHH